MYNGLDVPDLRVQDIQNFKDPALMQGGGGEANQGCGEGVKKIFDGVWWVLKFIPVPLLFFL